GHPGYADREVDAVTAFRFTGPLESADVQGICDRSSAAEDETLRRRVAELIARVRQERDAALRAFARDFDKVELGALEVPRDRWRAARAGLRPELRAALERAATNIRKAHEAFLPRAVEVETEP